MRLCPLAANGTDDTKTEPGPNRLNITTPAPFSGSFFREAFFQRFRIAGTETHVIRRGESLWVLARCSFKIPIWLLRQYNPDLDFDSVKVGVSVTVPKLEPIEDPSPAATTTASADVP